jgi:hypothetical protein
MPVPDSPLLFNFNHMDEKRERKPKEKQRYEFKRKEYTPKQEFTPQKKKKKQFLWVDHRMTNATADFDKWMKGTHIIVLKQDVVCTQAEYDAVSIYVWKGLYAKGTTIMDAMKYLFGQKKPIGQ